MSSLYRPKLKSGGYSRFFWCKYYVNGRRVRESTRCENRKDAERFLKRREGSALERYQLNRSLRFNGVERFLGRAATAVLPAAVITAPLVYAFITRGGGLRYLGMSRRGIERPLHRRHQAHAALASDDKLYIWTFATAQEAAEAEQQLITALAPSGNRQIDPATFRVVMPPRPPLPSLSQSASHPDADAHQILKDPEDNSEHV